MLKAIVFDFDGVIADTFDLALQMILENGKIVSRKQYRDHHDGNVFEEPAIIFSEEDSDRFYEKRMTNADAKHLFPLKTQIEELSKNYRLIIISSTREKLLKKYLDIGRIVTNFCEVLGKETHKSKVEKFKMIFEKYK